MTQPTRAEYDQVMIPCYKPADLVMTHGKKCRLYDSQNRSYLDFGGGIAVNSLGNAPKIVRKALKAQSAKLCHISFEWFCHRALSPKLKQSLRFRKAEAQIYHLHRLSGCSFYQIVDSRDHNSVAGFLIHAEADVTKRQIHHIIELGKCRTQTDQRTRRISALISLLNLFTCLRLITESRRKLHSDRGKDSALKGPQVRRKDDRAP